MMDYQVLLSSLFPTPSKTIISSSVCSYSIFNRSSIAFNHLNSVAAEEYERTWEQNEELGLNDMDTSSADAAYTNPVKA